MAEDDVYLLTVRQVNAAGVNQNTLAFRRTTAAEPLAADFASIAVEIKDLHRATQNSAHTYQSWKARQIHGDGVTWPTGSDCSPLGGKLFEGTFSTATTGGLSGDMLPPQAAMVTTLRTGIAGRRFRGRFYAGGFGETSQTAGVWDGSHVTTVSTAWADFLAKYAVAAPTTFNQLGIWSMRTATGCEPDPATGKHHRVEAGRPDDAFTMVTTHVVRPYVYTQRRRVFGVGI